MITVDETFYALPSRYLGLDVATGTREPARDLLPCPLVIEYEIVGPETAVWHVIGERDQCRVVRGAATAPFTRIRVTADDWLSLWTSETSVWSLLRDNRIGFTPEEPEALNLPYLGLLGPAVGAPRSTVWLLLHPVSRCEWGYFVSGLFPDFELFRHWRYHLIPNPLMLVAITAASAAVIWWLAGAIAGLLGGVAILALAWSVLRHIARKGEHNPVVFRWSLMMGLVTVVPHSSY